MREWGLIVGTANRVGARESSGGLDWGMSQPVVIIEVHLHFIKRCSRILESVKLSNIFVILTLGSKF